MNKIEITEAQYRGLKDLGMPVDIEAKYYLVTDLIGRPEQIQPSSVKRMPKKCSHKTILHLQTTQIMMPKSEPDWVHEAYTLLKDTAQKNASYTRTRAQWVTLLRTTANQNGWPLKPKRASIIIGRLLHHTNAFTYEIRRL